MTVVESLLLDLGAHDVHERGIRVETVDLRDLGLLGQVLGHVAERGADLEDRETARAAAPQVAQERIEEEARALLLEREVERGAPGPLALDQQPDHAGAIAGLVRPPVHREHAPVSEVRQMEGRLAHREQYSNRLPPHRDRQQHVAEESERGPGVEQGPGRPAPRRSRGAPIRGVRRGSAVGRRRGPRGTRHGAAETPQRLAQDPRRVVGVERANREAMGGQALPQLAPGERELVELAAGHAGQPGPAAQIRRAEPAHTVPVRHREQQPAARGHHARGLFEDRVGPVGVVLDDAQRQIGRDRAGGDGQGAQVHDRNDGAGPRAGPERVQAPVDAQRDAATLPEQQHVLAETAARLEHPARRGQMALDQVGERRLARDPEQLLHGVAAPVLGPELGRGRA